MEAHLGVAYPGPQHSRQAIRFGFRRGGRGSPLASKYAPSNRPVCHMVADEQTPDSFVAGWQQHFSKVGAADSLSEVLNGGLASMGRKLTV